MMENLLKKIQSFDSKNRTVFYVAFYADIFQIHNTLVTLKQLFMDKISIFAWFCHRYDLKVKLVCLDNSIKSNMNS